MILHHTGYARRGGGILAVLSRLAPHLRGRAVLGAGPLPESRLAGSLRQAALPAGSPDRICAASLRSAFRLALGLRVRELLRGRRRVGVHGHSREGLLLALWLHLLGDPSAAVTVHALGSRRWVYRWASWLLDGRLACLGPAMKLYYDLGDSSWDGCLPDCAPAPVAVAAPAPAPRTDGSCVIGCVGALAPVKEWELAAAALPKLPPGFRILHAGSAGPDEVSSAYAATLRDALRGESAAGRWTWSGQVSDMNAWYAGIDCLLVCGRLEALSVAALEASALGIPVVAPRGSGTRDLLQVLGRGFLFADGDADALAAVLRRVQPELRREAPAVFPSLFSTARVAEAHGRLWTPEPVL
jgi:glycosyltransferase involved in cell wall biosynthesis